jgi:hypothetical protein
MFGSSGEAALTNAMDADSSPSPSSAIKVSKLNFDYGSAGGYKPILKDVSFELPKGV